MNHTNICRKIHMNPSPFKILHSFFKSKSLVQNPPQWWSEGFTWSAWNRGRERLVCCLFGREISPLLSSAGGLKSTMSLSLNEKERHWCPIGYSAETEQRGAQVEQIPLAPYSYCIDILVRWYVYFMSTATSLLYVCISSAGRTQEQDRGPSNERKNGVVGSVFVTRHRQQVDWAQSAYFDLAVSW
jgi:hypothetical protein